MATETIVDTERKTRPGKFVWFEHISNDPKRAQAFYSEVIGWKVMPWGESYEMIQAGDTHESMVGGYASARNADERARWVSYVSVDDVDEAARVAAANGGTVVEEPFDIPDVGRTARLADPQGAEFYVFKSNSGDGPDAPGNEGPPSRYFFWNELHTTDPDQALAFYEKLLGYTRKSMDMGPAGAYHVLSSQDVGRAGVTGHLGQGENGGAPHWLPYVSVDDPDGTVERAKKHGGKVHMGPEDIPGVGRFAVIEDPTGAVLAVMKATPPAKQD